MVHRKILIMWFLIFFLIKSVFTQSIVVPTGSSWKIFDQGGINSNTWKNIGFDDNSWAVGNAELGYGDGDETTVVGFGGNPSNKFTTTYFRKNVNFSNVSNLECRVKVDDGCVVYLNGTEVFRNNLPTGTINPNTFALTNANENTWHSFSVPSTATVSGVNTFAVEMHQQSSTSSDLSFDLESIWFGPPPPAGIYINEFMASNGSVAIQNHSGFDDWIELRNTYSVPVDLSGYYVTDDLTQPTKFRLPTAAGSVVIPANGYLVLICSGNTALGATHLSFSLSANGEAVGLFQPDGLTVVDTLTFEPQQENVSMGRNPDNIFEQKYLTNPTPEAPNNFNDSYNELLSAPVFSQEAGFYNANFNLTISSLASGTTIYYTTDGSIPDVGNLTGKTYSYKNNYPGGMMSDQLFTNIYSSPIAISNRSSSPNKTSNKATSFSDNFYPLNSISKGTVVKAMAIKSDALHSPVVTKTYFVYPSPQRYSLPVISISTDEDNLFGYSNGIYTAGKHYDDYSYMPLCHKGNYILSGDAWERPGHFEYFVTDSLRLRQKIGLRIHGGCSRTYPRKSMRIISNDKLDYPFFATALSRRFSKLLLRNSGQDWNNTLIRDAVYHNIVGSLNFGKQETALTITFINGEYWGIQDLRERIDAKYIKELFNVNSDNIDLIQYSGGAEVEEGTLDAYSQLNNFLENNNFAITANYDSLQNLVDVNNLIDYQVAQIFNGNLDWPQNNVRLWRYKATTFNPALKTTADGRWRWLLFDTDIGLGLVPNVSTNLIDRAMDNSINGTLPLRKMLENTGFKHNFINRFADLLNSVFLPARTVGIVNEWKNKLDPEITEHIERWGHPSSKSSWLDNIGTVTNFLNEKPNYQRSHLLSSFTLANSWDITLNALPLAGGYVKINTMDVLPTTPGLAAQPYPWTGTYFEGVPVKITAKKRAGYVFKHWLHNAAVVGTDTTLTIDLTENQAYTAVFESTILSSNPQPAPKVLDGCGYKFNEWAASTAVGTQPQNAAFVYFDQIDPTLSANISGFTSGVFNLTTRTRVNGLGLQGVSFINTSNTDGNVGYPGVKLGGLLLALNTTNQDSLTVSWLGGTVQTNPSRYAIRLQYRIGDQQPFQDVLGSNGNAVEYVGNVSGHTQLFENIKLPQTIMNQPYVQLLWRYYFTGVGSGARDQLRLDEIIVAKNSISYAVGTVQSSQAIIGYRKINSSASIAPSATVGYTASESIILKPGFNANQGTVFTAQIGGCN